MQTGIKVSFPDGIQLIKQTKAQCCEVWFRLDWQERYQDLFKFFKESQVDFGLHFWATVQGEYLPNLLSPRPELAQKTFSLIKETIEIAAGWGASYVNFHPESYYDAELDLDRGTIKRIEPTGELDKEKSFKQLINYLEKLNAYGKENQVKLFIETVPKYAPANTKTNQQGRLKPEKIQGLETEKFFELARLGFSICLDFGHTMAQYITQDRDKLFNYLYQAAQRLKPAVGLIHVTTNRPPFNGTDSHNGILEKDFKQRVIPNQKQLIKLLSLFKNQAVWLIPEPAKEDMVENFFTLQRLASSLPSP